MSHEVPDSSHEVSNLFHQVEKVQCQTVIHKNQLIRVQVSQSVNVSVKTPFIEAARRTSQPKINLMSSPIQL